MMDGPQSVGIGGVPPSSGRKRKRHATNTPEAGIGQPSSGGKQKRTLLIRLMV
jgi:hypothetical protein